MITKDKTIETTLAHEFWCCRRELNTFLYYSEIQKRPTKENELIVFTSYGNFLRHLYSFYEGIIIEKNSNLVEGLSTKSKNEKISKLLTQEVKKLARNKKNRINAGYELDSNEINFTNQDSVDLDFGNQFRFIRNRFSHVNAKRINKEEITLSEFYKKYNLYIMLLFESSNFTWSIKNLENYNWLEIETFTKEITAHDTNQ